MKEKVLLFWEKEIGKLKRIDLELIKEINKDVSNDKIDVFNIEYNGSHKCRIKGYYIKPIGYKNMPIVIHFHGFGSHKLIESYDYWYNHGFSVISFDIRGQGGETIDNVEYEIGNDEFVVCKGLDNETNYYYKHVYLDCLKTIDLVSIIDEDIDQSKIILDGGSQGGGIVCAVASLDNRPIIAFSDVPSYCNFRERVLRKYGSARRITDFLDRNPLLFDKVHETLEYFDILNLVQKIDIPVIMSVGGNDKVCPEYLCKEAYKLITSPKEFYLYENAGHEGGGREFNLKKYEIYKKHVK